MKNHFLSKFNAYLLKETIIYLVISVFLITVPLIVGTTDNLPMILMLFTGVVLTFYAVLYPLEKVSYYAVMSVMFAVLFIILLFLGTDILVKMEAAGQLPVHGAEGIAMLVGFICISGIIAGLFGMFRFK